MLIPASSHEIDAAWLSEALAPRFPGARAEHVEVARSAELTNHHAHLQVSWLEPGERGVPPSSIFCKLLPTEEPRRSAVARTAMGPREAQFYARLAPSLSLRVPDAYLAHHEGDGSFVLLLEDLEATGCTVSDGTIGVAPDAADRALEDLARMHVRFADPMRRTGEAGWVPPPLHDPSYGTALLKVGLEQHRDRLTHGFADIAQRYVDAPDAMHALWQKGPMTVVHGDPHIGNLFDDHGRTGFLDWGIISTGHPLRDVSYFLCMALSIEDRRHCERDLLRGYLARWNAASTHAFTFDEAFRTHRIHAAYTVLACCQIVTFPEDESPARRTFSEAFLARAEAAVADLDALGALREEGL